MASYGGRVADEAFITLATNDVYARGALVLAESLKKQETMRLVVVMITPQVTSPVRSALKNVFDVVRVVDILDSGDAAHLACLKRPELGVTFTKIHCWTFTEYSKCVFMDADMLALQNIDDLFEREELSAAPDSGWPDIFNSGLFVFRPSLETFNNLLLFADNEGSFDGGDQGLLNSYFSSWARSDISRHLPFLYNLHVSASYQYLPAFKRFGKDTKVVHFLGPVKPWHHSFNKTTGHVQEVPGTSQSGVRHFPQYLNEWWAIYNEKVQKYFPQQQQETDHSTDKGTSHQEQGDECHGLSETQDQTASLHEHHEAHSQHDQSEPPNPFHWELPHTFFKTQPSYDVEPPPPPPPPPPEHRPTICITAPSTVTLSPPKSTKMHAEVTPVHSDHKVSITNVSKKENYVSRSSKSGVLHGDPNIVVQPTKYEFTPIEKENGFTAPSTEESREDPNEMMAQGTSSHDITLTPPPLPANDLTTAQVEEEMETAKMAHMEAWQRGEVDYMGRDRFDNIQAALDAFL